MRRNVYFGNDLRDAQTRAGLSNRQIWQRLGISESTWARMKREGTVPIERLMDVVMLLELPEPADLEEDVPRTPWAMLEMAHRGNAVLDRLALRVSRIEEHLGLAGSAQSD